MRRVVYWTWLAIALGLVVLAGWQTVRTLRDERFPTGMIYNADFLAPAALYQDLVVDGYSIRGFHPAASTFAFPDYVVYFVVRGVVGDTRAAVPLWMLALILVLLASGWTALVALIPHPARAYLVPVILSWFAFYVAVNSYTFFATPAADLLMPVYHTGAQIGAFLGLALVVGVMRGGSGRGRVLCLGALVLVSAMSTFSDRLFGPYFAAPAAVTLFLLLLRRDRGDLVLPVTWRRSALVVGAIAVGCGAGLAAIRIMQGHTDPLDSYWGGGSSAGLGERVLAAVRMMTRAVREGNVLVLLSLAWYVLCAVAIGRWLTGREVGRGFIVYVVFSVAQLATMLGVFLVSKTGALAVGQDSWGEVSRYFVGPMASAFFGLVLVSAHAAAVTGWARGVGIGVPVGLAAVGLGVGLSQPRDEYYSLSDLRPRWIADVDRQCHEHGLRDGLTDYWNAKVVSLLSTRGIRPRQVYWIAGRPYNLQAHPWLANSEWYWKPPPGTDSLHYSYVLATPDTLDRPLALGVEKVVAELGEPRLRVPVAHLILLVYDRPSDVRFHRFAELNCTVLNHQFHAAGPRGPYRYPGNSLNSLTRVTTATDERVAEEGTSPKGLMVFGPYFRPPTAGWHKATFRLTCTGTTEANAAVSVTIYDPRTNTDRTLASRVIPPGTDGPIEVPFELTREMKRMELQFPVVFDGKGRVVLHWVEYE